MKYISFLISLLIISGCSSLQFAGTADYTVKPFIVDQKNGIAVCCEIHVHNGKEMSSIEAHINKQGENVTVDLKEIGVQAFKGQEIIANVAQDAEKAAGKAAATAALAPILPAILPAAGAIITSGQTGAVIGGAAAGALLDKSISK